MKRLSRMRSRIQAIKWLRTRSFRRLRTFFSSFGNFPKPLISKHSGVCTCGKLLHHQCLLRSVQNKIDNSHVSRTACSITIIRIYNITYSSGQKQGAKHEMFKFRKFSIFAHDKNFSKTLKPPYNNSDRVKTQYTLRVK